MGAITTHVLDTAHGTPARGLRIEAFRDGVRIADGLTNADGKLDQPVVEGAAFTTGRYEMLFHAADYMRARGVHLTEPPFYDVIRIAYGIADPTQHYHVPLLLSPYGYTTYRGS